LKSKVKELTLILFHFYCTENRKKLIKEKNIQKSFGNGYTASKQIHPMTLSYSTKADVFPVQHMFPQDFFSD